MICEKPTKKYPNGRRGTATGYDAHRRAGEPPCSLCKEANHRYHKEYRKKNGERVAAKSKEYRENNKDKAREYGKEWREKNRDKKREDDRKYKDKNRERISANYKEYYKENAEKIRKRARDWHHDNRERANAYSKGWREANPERFREAVSRWHKENADYLKEYRAEWRRVNGALLREYSRNYYRENRGRWEGYSRSRRALERSLPSEPYSPEDIVLLHGNICRLCQDPVSVVGGEGRSRTPHVDHVHPISREGCPGDVLSNVRLTHAICNIKKGDRMDEELVLPFIVPTGEEWDDGLL